MEKCLNGDRGAFDAIFDHHAARVYNLLRRLSADESAAEDLTQDTFVAAFRSLANWRGKGQLSSWLCGIAVRLYANHRRREDHLIDLIDDETLPNRLDGDPLQFCTQAESVRQIETSIICLPSIYREVFVLVKVEGMSYREVAEMLEIPLGTVQSRLWKAVRILQAALSQENRGERDSATVECEA